MKSGISLFFVLNIVLLLSACNGEDSFLDVKEEFIPIDSISENANRNQNIWTYEKMNQHYYLLHYL